MSLMRVFIAAVCVAVTARTASAQAPVGHANGHLKVRAEPKQGRIDVDGRIDEAGWAMAQPATDFIQFEPEEGKPATQRTEIRFLFDDEALYIAARMFDTGGGAAVRTRLARRDQVEEGDYIMFVFDTFHDHTGRTIFMLNPSGAKSDEGQASPFADPSWDPVWEGAARIDSAGWSAEFRIPWSQLRYPGGPDQTWGVQVWRYVERIHESSMWAPWGKQEAGGPQRFGHLEGLRPPDRKLAMEVMPYVVTRAEHVQLLDPTTPLRDASRYGVRIGGDVKALLTSTITLDATVNPDFGQVEVDPAQVNLSAFETFFDEKRPFFVEGSGLFGFGGFSCYFCSNVSAMSLFYSRRIGRSPQGAIDDAKYVETPDNSTILGAAKITGRTAGGYQIGILNALTASEKARAATVDELRFEREVEPLTNYFVGRVKRNLHQGNVTVGAIATSVVRRFENNALRELLPGHSEAIGLDWSASWAQRRYNFMGNFAVSSVVADTIALQRLQTSSARYFDRPDRVAGSNGLFSDRFDSSAESLRGFGGYMRMAKVAGSWQWEGAVNYRSPGFEANDIAFLTRADYFWMNANVIRSFTRPTRQYRELSFNLGAQQQYNFDGDLTDRQFHGSARVQLPSWWSLNTFVIGRPQVDEDRLMRGGAVVRRAASWYANAGVNSDPRRSLVLSGSLQGGMTEENVGNYSLSVSARFKPASSIALQLGPSYSRSESYAQFVRTFADPHASAFYGRRTVFAGLQQHTMSMDTRVSATFTPTLTFELFAQPFISTGDYDAFKEFVAPRRIDKTIYDASQLTAVRENGREVEYRLDPDRNPATSNFTFRNPDFNFRSLRGNAVFRWEYRPGSTLFLVWQQSRSASALLGDFDLSRDAQAVFRERPDNIFLVKLTYWMGG